MSRSFRYSASLIALKMRSLGSRSVRSIRVRATVVTGMASFVVTSAGSSLRARWTRMPGTLRADRALVVTWIVVPLLL
jgi:hypothetical protein